MQIIKCDITSLLQHVSTIPPPPSQSPDREQLMMVPEVPIVSVTNARQLDLSHVHNGPARPAILALIGPTPAVCCVPLGQIHLHNPNCEASQKSGGQGEHGGNLGSTLAPTCPHNFSSPRSLGSQH